MTRANLTKRIPLAGLLTGIADGLFGVIQYMLAAIPSPVARFFQGIAAVLLGKRPLHGGVPAIALGVCLHLIVALFWAALFAALLIRVDWVRVTLASRAGALKIAALYGPLIWTAMSFGVISPLVHHLPNLGSDWWIEFFGHILSAGLPIAIVFRYRSARLRHVSTALK